MKTKEIGIKSNSEIYFTTPNNQSIRLFYYITCLGHFYYDDFYSLERENYNSYLLMYIKKGKGRVYNQYGIYDVEQGDVILLDCYGKHGYESKGDLETIWMHFDGLNMKDIYNELQVSYYDIIRIRNSANLDEILKTLMYSYRENHRFQESMESYYISRIISEFFAVHHDNGMNSPRMNHMKQYIEEHFAEDLTIKKLAKIANISEFHFSRVFKKETGYTIHEYIVKIRINHAKSMLQVSNLTLKEIGYQCGFSNESSFSTIFKKHTGTTPGAFKSMKF